MQSKFTKANPFFSSGSLFQSWIRRLQTPQTKKKYLIYPWSGHIQCDIKNENIDIFEYIHLIMSILQT